MRIDELFAADAPVFSFEFFPPRTPEGVETLFETVEALKPLEPSFVSVTYGAGGATRDGTVEIATRIKREHGLETMAHLSCVGETTARAWSRSSTASRQAGSTTSSPCAATRRAARPSSSARRAAWTRAAELAGFISRALPVRDRRRLLPRGPSRRRRASRPTSPT